jgi:uncharacterized protein YdhG (YjbR/CyaY superfamily)
MRTAPASVAAYIAGFPRPVQIVLKRVRTIIRNAVPAAEETFSYQIPAFKLHGRPVLYFAAWKEHFSIYPSSARLVAAFRDELARYERAKGTIRFPLAEPVPEKLIARLAKFRAKEVVDSQKAKPGARKKLIRLRPSAASASAERNRE